MKLSHLALMLSLFSSCTDGRTESMNEDGLYQAKQKKLQERYLHYDVKFSLAANDINKREAYNDYHEYLRHFFKDSLDYVGNWIGRVDDISLTDSIVNFTITTLSGVFVANVNKNDTIGKTIANIPNRHLVAFSGKLNDSSFSYSDFSGDMPKYFINIQLDSIKETFLK